MDNKELINKMKPVPGMEAWARKQFKQTYIFYHNRGFYAECHCSECGSRYLLRTQPTEDPFKDAAMDIEKPKRDMETTCRSCKAKAIYKPAGHCRTYYEYKYLCVGQKINDTQFVFRVFYADQQIKAGHDAQYDLIEDKRILLTQGEKATRWSKWYWQQEWKRNNVGEQYRCQVHPKTFQEIKKTGMFKYVPVADEITKNYYEEGWVIPYYEAAARYKDFEMIVKMGLTEYARNLVYKMPVNPNPRGKNIEDRLRINKDRIKDLIRAAGANDALKLYQIERQAKAHWTVEELEIVKTLQYASYSNDWRVAIKHATPIRVKNYLVKQKMWPNKKDDWRKRTDRNEARREYYDYLLMREKAGYDMTDDIILFPKDLKRRHDEMVIESEKIAMDKRMKEVNEKYGQIAKKYKSLSKKYSAAAGGYIIRPAKDAAEIVMEGKVLHHCVGGDSYLSSHNKGNTTILFLRKANEKDIPWITVEIKGNEVKQWYGKYDRKDKTAGIDQKKMQAWLDTYCKELEKRSKNAKNINKSMKIVTKQKKTA